jgi:uncharacterized protein (DUF433 family)
MKWRQSISVDSKVCHGKACIKGTRVLVSVILDELAAGRSTKDIAADFHLTTQDVRAALLYAAELSKERYVSLGHRGVT